MAGRRKRAVSRARQRKLVEKDEQREVLAQAKHCLIDAYEDMRGHPDLPVVSPD
jgi:hypothetical protein